MERSKQVVINDKTYTQKTDYHVADMGFNLQFIGYVELYGEGNERPLFHANLTYRPYEEVAYKEDSTDRTDEEIMAMAESEGDGIIENNFAILESYLRDYEDAVSRGLYY